MTAFVEDLFGLTGQTAVVVGATGVLGGALAKGIAQAGANVVVSGLNAKRAEELTKEIEAFGGKAFPCVVDASKPESHKTLLDDAIRQFGGCDMLVNCAGVNDSTKYEDLTPEAWRRVFEINVDATHYACQVFSPYFAERSNGGAILNIGSVTCDKPLSKVYAYSASKAAVENLSKNVAREYARRGVRVNVLCPGFFPAEQNRKILDESRTTSILSQTPMARFGEPEELIGATILLLSRKAGGFITGSTVYVDGGFTAMRF
jgi:NAD(P)-dependent dehydrogenase (short-subunit alcohol dehydrogenase family)